MPLLRRLPLGRSGHLPASPAREAAWAAAGVAAGYLADRLAGEPPSWLHPVARFGAVMGWVERCCYRPSRAAGLGFAGVGLMLAAGAGAILQSIPATCYLAVAGRALEAAATAVDEALSAGDLDRARSLLPALVGRDVDRLDATGIARAVVESVAENTNDAVVAPLCYAATGWPALVLAHRAANTMDAMVGYRDDRYGRFGWASARLDDLLGYLPARVTALAVMAARPARAGAVARVVRRDGRRHPSPNAGVAEAAFAAALGLRLGGPASYGGTADDRAPLGNGRPAGPDDLVAAVALSRDVGRVVALAASVAAGVAASVATRVERGGRGG